MGPGITSMDTRHLATTPNWMTMTMICGDRNVPLLLFILQHARYPALSTLAITRTCSSDVSFLLVLVDKWFRFHCYMPMGLIFTD